MEELRYYTSGNLPLEVWGLDGVYVVTIWNPAPNAPIMLWAVDDNLWQQLTEKGIDIGLELLSADAVKMTISKLLQSDWRSN